MEVPLPLQRSLSCGIASSRSTHIRIKPFLGILPNGTTQSFGWRTGHMAAKVTYQINANFSRRRPRKSSTPSSKDSTPRGFGPRTQVPTSTQKKDRKNSEEKEGPGTSSQKEIGSLSADTPDVKIRSGEEETTNISLVPEVDEDGDGVSNDEHDVVGLEFPSTHEAFSVSKVSQFKESVQIPDVNKHVIESKDEGISNSEVSSIAGRLQNEKLAATGGVDDSYTSISELKRKEDEFLKLKLESEESLRKETINKLADANFRKGNKLFYYPELVKPDQHIEIFFNRSFSTLKNEPVVMIMGAFNDWKWKSFGMKLSKSHLKGDWWSCQLYVPKEAYKIDFVFYNGQDVYENNDEQDFCIAVEGGMDVFDFDNFLLEEKMREQEDLLRQKAERERQEEEQRYIEAEKAAIEADRAQAKEETAKTRGMMQVVMKKALISDDDVWYKEPKPWNVEGSGMVRLYYNRSSGPLSHAKDLWIHGGYNNWKDGLSIVSKLIKSGKDGDWWFADVVVPDRALVLDWVLADGPPQQAVVYDNNNMQDFHAIVPKSIAEELYWAEEEQILFRRLQTERRSREAAIRAKAEKTARLKAETKEKTLRTYLLSQKHIVYTDPLDVRAGSTVNLFYNPANTVLNGKSEVWLRCSFNRWTHRMGPLPPQKMIPAENSSHLKASVKVPLDAYMIDFVFSEREDGGIFDNKNGMDYHIPVLGGVVKEPPMHIVHISVEMAPIAKVGGLGDVVTSLSRAVQDMNHNVEIILPKYDCLNLSHVKDLQFHKSYSWGGTEIKVWSGKVEGISVYFLEPQNGLFWVGCIYGRGNDGDRFGFFCNAALEFLLQSGSHPDIIHCHDWSSAPVAWLFKEQYMHYGLSKARIVFTIHNLEFGAELIGKAMASADKATTVSPTYSREVSGNPVIAPYLYKFHGILNGIDPDIWDPYNDKFLPVSYTSENVVEGKQAAKEALQERLGLKKADLPMVGIITRLTHQKGIHLIKHAIWRTLERNGQVVLLGSAPDPRIQNDFVNLANQLHSSHTDRARLCLTYDEPLSHLIYAGADFILVPSIFEPCGLTQLTAMRYGSVPVVRKTGGLYDTVYDVDHDVDRAQEQGLQPNGFNFDGADAGGVDYALNRAISAWYDKREWFYALCKCVMEQDWSWNRPALDYLELYNAARK
ncbi:soluble starch synthase 3, chloroplastic/amyloplastic-like isoform X2 [Salvia splendens]|uniref:soluble starch synthase 3, chloroplastic/amyloplastic-like isoform X2 n=1 Tax=Salvia splendens TaxID=180675 RepID=UPI001C261815|nr:soluble starch synthase 3, chloroplastic/amyloplastic-like isoform X2 [Salvia splendens]